MSDDPLDHAIAAYTGARRAAPDPAATRARLLRSAHVAHRRRRMRAAVGIVVALLATNATTWAWSSGRIERAVAAWTAPPHPSATTETVGAAPAVPATAPALAAAPSAPTDPPTTRTVGAPDPAARASAPATPAPPPTTRSVGARSPTARAPIPALAAEPSPPASPPTTRTVGAPDSAAAPSDTADRRAFEAAHRAHFQGGPDAVALAAWDAYLAGFPAGRFVPEATFNRAICLLRLGEADAARAVLETIAAGAQGTAHQADARALLAGMR